MSVKCENVLYPAISVVNTLSQLDILILNPSHNTLNRKQELGNSAALSNMMTSKRSNQARTWRGSFLTVEKEAEFWSPTPRTWVLIAAYYIPARTKVECKHGTPNERNQRSERYRFQLCEFVSRRGVTTDFFPTQRKHANLKEMQCPPDPRAMWVMKTILKIKLPTNIWMK